MDRLFDESFVRPLGSPMLTAGYGVALDVQTDKDEYVLRANVPGLKPEDLHVEVVDNTVTIHGEIKEESKLLDGRRGYVRRTSHPLRCAAEAFGVHRM